MSNASKSSASFLVFALRPCDVLDHVIREAKINTREIAGDQIYLDHPPHLTLYVAAFDEPAAAADRCRAITERWTSPEFDIVGWHHFGGDVLTGNQTLVCQISQASQETLRSYQSSLIQELSGLRNDPQSRQRYLPHYASLSQQRQQAVDSVGFPFIGTDWIPHFTVASIDNQHWPDVWRALKDQPPQGRFTCDLLSVFRLVDDHPVDWQEIALGNQAAPT